MLRFGKYTFDIATHGLVMGILNRTTDSFFDKGAYFEFSKFLERAEELVSSGAEILDVGGVKAGAGPAISTQEELDRVVPAVSALVERFDVAVSIDTWNSIVLDEALSVGGVCGNDISGFGDPKYLEVAARHDCGVIATHIRLAPRVPDPDPVYHDLYGQVCEFLTLKVNDAISSGVDRQSIVIDAGLDLGKTTAHSLELLARTGELIDDVGFPLLLSASNKDFIGGLLGYDVSARGPGSISSAIIAYLEGARIFRVHDVKGTRRALEISEAIADSVSPSRQVL
ncbi:dihydropteroate synthase [Acidithrix sp. C25]|uniref:dihydropteroate synthase n=1 Tax=Acidithrix sp. C25 TaxID=1671482 RepID=UPI00191BAB81|nr:dihydropteroate synthase [Acidithrix sp. C25]CAG4927149.1 unnamed protein product [Acidithrix sp. C25]